MSPSVWSSGDMSRIAKDYFGRINSHPKAHAASNGTNEDIYSSNLYDLKLWFEQTESSPSGTIFGPALSFTIFPCCGPNC